MAERSDKQTERDEPRDRRLGLRLREAGRSLQERVLWPVSDWIRHTSEWVRIAFDAAIWPFERLAWAIRTRLFWPLQDLLTDPGGKARGRRTATIGAISALALGSLGAGALVASGTGDEATGGDTPVVVAQASEPEPEPPVTSILAKTEPEPKGDTLKGVRPRFGAKSAAERKAAKKALRKLKAEKAAAPRDQDQSSSLEETTGAAGSVAEGRDGDSTVVSNDGENPQPDEETDPVTGATASNAAAEERKRRRESPLSVAERFAVAFVSYEIGGTARSINLTFRDTTEEDLFKALRKRPPRQPKGTKVPKARVMNVVGGPRKKQAMEVSVGLLRVNGVSELRLEMEKADRGWVVKTVRG